jgi:hypothetical protein
MNRFVSLLILSAILFVSCDKDSDNDQKEILEIELISPAEIHGDIVDLPINTPIRFQAKCNVEDAGEIYWYAEDDWNYHSLDEEISFDENGLYRIYFVLKDAKYSAESKFIWINVVGKTVTNVEDDEVGVALVENDNSIYVFTKKRKSFSSKGVFLYKYTEGELDKSEFLENVDQIYDAKNTDDGRIILLTNDGFVLLNTTDGSAQYVNGSLYKRAHIMSCKNEELVFVGIEEHKGILERRKFSGELVEQKVIYEDEDHNKLKDIGFLNENDFVILAEIIEENYYGIESEGIAEKRISLNSTDDKGTWSRDFEYLIDGDYATDAGIHSMKSGVMLYAFHSDRSLIQINYNHKYEMNFRRNFSFEPTEIFATDDYFCDSENEEYDCHDRRVWGWQDQERTVTLFQNQMVVEHEYRGLYRKPKLFEVNHSYKIDWVFESEDSHLILVNTQKYGKFDFDYKGNSKRYCSVFRVDEKGKLMDLY